MVRKGTLWLCLLMTSASCAPPACHSPESQVEREVEVLIGEAGPAVKEAKRRLLARGPSAIAIVETGLYQAEPLGRVRIVDLLAAYQSSEAIPILKHIARFDEDPMVRQRAEEALAKAP